MIEIQRMTEADIQFGMQLSMQEGWNQVEMDWLTLLNCGQNRCFVAVLDGQKVGTVTSVYYPPDILWVGMLLVRDQFRRRGIGTRLIEAVHEAAEDRSTLYLDATTLGKGIYLNAGFKSECRLVRMLRRELQPLKPVGTNSRRISEKDLNEIERQDQDAFGVKRRGILETLLVNHPDMAFGVEKDQKLTGFCLGRRGWRYDHIGPIVACDGNSALKLLQAVLGRDLQRPTILDVPTTQLSWIDSLNSIGFDVERSFTRMRFGHSVLKTDFQRYFAAAGPEFG